MKKIFFILLTLAVSCALFAANSTVYKYAPDVSKSDKYKIFIDGAECLVYPTKLADIAAFDITGETKIKVVSTEKIVSFEIRPLSKKISAKKSDDNTLEFTMPSAANLSVEINGIEHPLFVFGNPPIKNVPQKSDKNTIFFEAGKVHDLGLRVQIPSDTTVYIEGGAIVYGSFRIGDRQTGAPMQNVRICGNGILSCEKIPPAIEKKGPSSQGVEFHKTDGIKLEGFVLVQSPNWSIPMFASQNIHIDNIKTVCDIGCDDGIDVVSCKNVLIENCFLRNKDDCIAIKAGVGYAPKYFKHDQPNNSENITVRNTIVWNGIWGNGVKIGFETRGDEIKNIVFENLDMIHVQSNRKWKGGKEGAFTIHNGDRAKIHNVLYKNIRVEDVENYLFDIRIMFSRYSKDKQRGQISNVRFEDIFVSAKEPLKGIIEGFDANCAVSEISFKNVLINSIPIKDSKEISIESSKNASGISFR